MPSHSTTPNALMRIKKFTLVELWEGINATGYAAEMVSLPQSKTSLPTLGTKPEVKSYRNLRKQKQEEIKIKNNNENEANNVNQTKKRIMLTFTSGRLASLIVRDALQVTFCVVHRIDSQSGIGQPITESANVHGPTCQLVELAGRTRSGHEVLCTKSAVSSPSWK